MATLELTVRPGREAERFATAFYRFLELKLSSAAQVEDHAHIATERAGDSERKTVVLWSDSAVRDFADYWRDFRKPHLRH